MSGTRYTFKANRDTGRHGWLRLTPAYSVGLVNELLEDCTSSDLVLDPFCGTGTTALACAERGIPSVTTEINPFLEWLATAKVRTYSTADLETAVDFARSISDLLVNKDDWVPPIHRIDRWWGQYELNQLAALWRAVTESVLNSASTDLLKVAFCQVMMECSRANHRHQSISLKHDISHKLLQSHAAQTAILSGFCRAVETVCAQVAANPLRATPAIHLQDARLAPPVEAGTVTRVITSPPYANRMSYVRELRPYMYWLGMLESGRAAGELDWQAIGGTWGIATSNLSRWQGTVDLDLDSELATAIDSVTESSYVLGQYLRKYVEDTEIHLTALRPALAPGATVTYIVGNSTFYGTLFSTERLYASLFARIELEAIEITTLRKRTSGARLYEFAVTGRVPSSPFG